MIVLRVLMAIAASTVLTVALVLLARVTRKRHRMRGTPDIEPTYITTVGTLYGIFIAFMIFTVWNQYNDARQAIEKEANAVVDVRRLARGLSEPNRERVRQASMDYARSVVNDEWPAMAHGRPSLRTERISVRMWTLLVTNANYSPTDSLLRDHILYAWKDVMDLRRLRLLSASSGITGYAYALLIIGALITVGLACLFTVDDLPTHVLKAGSLAAIIALMLVTIWGLDHPFSSNVRIQPIAFTRAMHAFGEQ